MNDVFIQAIAIVILGMIAFSLGTIREALKDIERALRGDEEKEKDNEQDV